MYGGGVEISGLEQGLFHIHGRYTAVPEHIDGAVSRRRNVQRGAFGGGQPMRLDDSAERGPVALPPVRRTDGEDRPPDRHPLRQGEVTALAGRLGRAWRVGAVGSPERETAGERPVAQVGASIVGQPSPLLRIAERQTQPGDAPGRDGLELRYCAVSRKGRWRGASDRPVRSTPAPPDGWRVEPRAARRCSRTPLASGARIGTSGRPA